MSLLDLVSHPIVVSFMNIISLVNLDTSCGSTEQRLDLWESHRLSFQKSFGSVRPLLYEALVIQIDRDSVFCPLLDWLDDRLLKCVQIRIDQGHDQKISDDLMDAIKYYLLCCQGQVVYLTIPANKQLLKALTKENFGFAPRLRFTETLDTIEDTIMAVILGSTTKLERLHICNGFKLTKVSFDTISTKFPLLQTLVYDGDFFTEMLDKCHNLSRLEVFQCSSFACLKHIALKSCNLRKLAIEVLTDDSDYTEQEFRDALIHLKTIESLKLGATMKFSSATVAFVRMCAKLMHLNLNNTYLTGDDLKIISRACKLLVVVQCSETLVNDAGFKSVVINCSDIRVMDFSHCKKVTDVSASAAALYCKKLVYLGLLNCSISKKFIGQILHNNPQLLNIGKTDHGITHSKLQHVSSLFPESVRKYFQY